MQLSLKQNRVALGASARRTAVAVRTPVRLCKWDRVENKTGVLLYSFGALTAVWLASTIVSAVNTLPLVPKLFELVGLTYTSWFAYRYLLFQETRDELVRDVEELKQKITGGNLK
ncbi:Uncharacterized protein MNEG_11089 [Monoraphidium neglectum]|uniref:Cyanobacterial aminoacyl-tRNA synthetase CAAD domain-containing protein n=1 Tax=Monoraphidium neglectum TaxID=145388 RepID=A0A0D2KMA7_9CHLO|nr:Uncharacterized protein MNEG_11089 [Monoraphidium neglectum]KIY96873.1 Uncharacterized protein MNEG_11089 [Monoraphidium neglectum]|eukprot:XP_013895893.1 Uncharacterized protein MNEG_11089 [Monoraphidium neglectum]